MGAEVVWSCSVNIVVIGRSGLIDCVLQQLFDRVEGMDFGPESGIALVSELDSPISRLGPVNSLFQ